MTGRPRTTDAGGPDALPQAEWERLAQAASDRFAPYLHAAAEAVSEAERQVAVARAALLRAEQAAADTRYVSDPRVFMRVAVREELEALSRKTTQKKARASFRYLLARAAELAEGELHGYRADLEAARGDRQEGADACRRIQQEALSELEAARAMQKHVVEAAGAAREGLELLKEMMLPEPG
jgi:hypothetical protein